MTLFSLKNKLQQFKEKGIFHTNEKLAIFLKGLLPSDVKEVYDPTCGAGDLLRVFGDDVKKFGQEIEEEFFNHAKDNLKNFTGVQGNTLTNPAFINRKFEAIIANPPFSIAWEHPETPDVRFSVAPALAPKSKADYAFILHCLHMLSPNGKAVILCSPGALYRSNAEGRIRQWLIEQNAIERVVSIPSKMFDDTSIETCALVLSKSKTTSDVIFSRYKDKRDRVASIEEIKENNGCLSVSQYIVDEIKKEKVDPIDLQIKARQRFLQQLVEQLQLDAMICQIENYSHPCFVPDVFKSAIINTVQHVENTGENNGPHS